MNATKQNLLTFLLNCNASLLAYVDGRGCTGLPAPLNAHPSVALRLGWFLNPDIRLVAGELGFNCTVLIKGIEYPIGVPWSAMFGVSTESYEPLQVVWPIDQSHAAQVTEPPRLKLVD